MNTPPPSRPPPGPRTTRHVATSPPPRVPRIFTLMPRRSDAIEQRDAGVGGLGDSPGTARRASTRRRAGARGGGGGLAAAAAAAAGGGLAAGGVHGVVLVLDRGVRRAEGLLVRADDRE